MEKPVSAEEIVGAPEGATHLVEMTLYLDCETDEEALLLVNAIRQKIGQYRGVVLVENSG